MDILAHTLKKKIPFLAQFNLTGNCNLNCLHCCVRNRDGEKGKDRNNSGPELSFMEICRILKQLAQAGCLVLTLSGGEVLLREDLIDIIKYARNLDFAVKVFTNGTLLGGSEAKSFRELQVQEVHLSLYAGQAKVHDEITGVSGSWEKTVEGIRRLRGEGISVKIKCAIMRQNFSEYRKVYDLAGDLGCSYAFDPMITARDDGSKDTLCYRIAKEDLVRILQDQIFQEEEEEEGGDGIKNSSFLISEIYNELPCNATHNTCFISPEGMVTPCVQMPLSCGNLRDHDFDWIWHHSPQMLQIRKMRVSDIREKCKNCSYLSWCARCPGLAYIEDGDLLGPSSAACWMAEAAKSLEINVIKGGISQWKKIATCPKK